jgi:hypothetical protein
VPVCKAIASSIKSWRGFIDIMMTEYTWFYSLIHLIFKSASRFGHLNILKWLSLSGCTRTDVLVIRTRIIP